MPEDKLRILVKRVGHPFEVQEIDHTLEAIQGLVGGYIEVAPYLPHPYVIVCNGEGKLIGLTPNFHFEGDTICGDAFITKVDGEDFASLDDLDIKILSKLFVIKN